MMSNDPASKMQTRLGAHTDDLDAFRKFLMRQREQAKTSNNDCRNEHFRIMVVFKAQLDGKDHAANDRDCETDIPGPVIDAHLALVDEAFGNSQRCERRAKHIGDDHQKQPQLLIRDSEKQ
jgi:hypothetical protein